MRFTICLISRQQSEHGLHAVASFQAAGGAAVGVGGNFGVVLAVGGQAHDVVPVEAPQLRQVVAVEAGVVGEDALDAVMRQPCLQIPDGFRPGAEEGLDWGVQKEGVVIHAASPALLGQDVVFHFDGLIGVRIGDDGADGHDLIGPVGFGINDGEFSHFRSPWVVFRDSISEERRVCNGALFVV